MRLLESVDPSSRLERVRQKHRDRHRPDAAWDRRDGSGDLGGFLVADVPDEPVPAGALWVLRHHSKSTVSKSNRQGSCMETQGARRKETVLATMICTTQLGCDSMQNQAHGT